MGGRLCCGSLWVAQSAGVPYLRKVGDPPENLVRLTDTLAAASRRSTRASLSGHRGWPRPSRGRPQRTPTGPAVRPVRAHPNPVLGRQQVTSANRKHRELIALITADPGASHAASYTEHSI